MTDEPELCVHTGFYGTRLTNAWEMIERTGDPEVRARGGDDRPLSLGPPAAGPGRGGGAGRARLYPSIATIPDGPLWVRGGIPVEGPGGQLYAVRNRVTLCRCGPSHNKPFCDGTHKEVGFRSPRRDHRRA